MMDALAMEDLAEADAELRDELPVQSQTAAQMTNVVVEDNEVIEISSDEDTCCDEPEESSGGSAC